MEIGALPTEGPGVFRTLLLPDTARALEEGEELESYTPQRLEEMDRRFEEGMVELREIFRGQARRMVEKYGRLISQLHPEDFCARLGKDFFDDTMFLQDLGLMLDNAPQYFDFEHNEEDRKLRIFYDYFHNAVALHGIYFINVRSF